MENFKSLLAQLYIGYFGRAPEPEGLDFWEKVLEEGFSIQEAAQDFASQAETLAQYPYLKAPDNNDLEDFLSNVYNNLFCRPPDLAGLVFWTEAIEAGLPIGTAILDIVNGAQGNDINALENKVELALRWTELANTEPDFELTSEGMASSRAALALASADPASVGPEGAARNALDNFFNDTPSLSIISTVTSLSEDADTSSRIEVAEIAVADDDLGQNMLSLSGGDAGLFEIEGNKLFLKADAQLDFETAAQLDVVVGVDDPEIGSTPDDSSAFSLKITDVADSPDVADPPDVAEPPVDTVQRVDRSRSTSDEVITLSGNSETIVKTGSGNDNITAGDGPNNIDAGEGNNTVTTGSGSDTIVAGSGNDTVSSGSGNDTVTIGDGDDAVHTGADADLIIAGNGGGDDFIDGGPGADTVAYPSLTSAEPVGIDLSEIDRSGDAFIAGILTREGLATNTPVGVAYGGPWVGTDVLISIENASGGAGNDTISGNDNANDLGGAEGDDFLYGHAGSDRLDGGLGDDTLVGGADTDILIAGRGNDMISGGSGYDELVLSGSSDDYSFDNIGDGFYTVTDNRTNADGMDTISNIELITFSDITVGIWTLVGALETHGTAESDLLEGSDGPDLIFGYGGDDEIFGFAGGDDFIGGSGNDTIDGGTGTDDDENYLWDTVNYISETFDGGTQGVTVNLATGLATDTFGDTDTLIEIERIYGTNFDDVLIGSDENGGEEAFDPFGGNDTIEAGGGDSDRLIYNSSEWYGGFGGITVEFDLVTAGSGVVSVDAFGDRDVFSGIEQLSATNSDDLLMGGAGRQVFMSLNGTDTIDGGTGVDEARFHQEAGRGGTLGITLNMEITNAEGFAVVTDGWGNNDLIRNVEDIRGTGAADEILGDNAANTFSSRAGDDILEGRGGNDTLLGENGDDILDGGIGEDILSGGIGNDTLTGGSDNDWMSGGLDADTFVFAPGDGNDLIADFSVGEDALLLQGGLAITSHTEADVDSVGGLDTVLDLSSGETITLLGVTGVTDTSLLF